MSFNQDFFDLMDLDPTSLDDASFQSKFQEIATDMFKNYSFIVNGVTHRFTEIEFYLNGGNHKDDFAHDDEIQKRTAAFYFHKTGGKYRGGSFKGMDITFGKEGYFGGILIRGIQRLDAPRELIDGPSLVVDHILKTCGVSTIVDLVAQLNDLKACDSSNIIHVSKNVSSKTSSRQVYHSARVGLTLKDYSHNREEYLCRFYRFFTHPKEIKKGKPLMVLALHSAGHSEHDIHSTTGTPKNTVHKYTDLYNLGHTKQMKDFYTKDLSTDDLCLVHGLYYSNKP